MDYTHVEGQEFTDRDGCRMHASRPRDIKFIADMEEAGIPWRWYSGRDMNGRYCPSVTTREHSEADIMRSTSLNGLHVDQLGKHRVIYTG